MTVPESAPRIHQPVTSTPLAEAEATALDAADPLGSFRSRFAIPPGPDGGPEVYLAGNSLGLLPLAARDHVNAELDRWAELGVRGHFTGDLAWMPYHQLLTGSMAAIVGAGRDEVVVMNSLTVNLHLLMVSFYRPSPERHKILIEAGAFPSDHFAVESQIRQRGFDPATSLHVLEPRPGEETLRPGDVLATINDLGPELALIMWPGVQYYSGQVFDMAAITRAGHGVGATVGFDLAHAAGNVELQLHDWGVDFAAWCSYKYLNGGPGGVGGCFVNDAHVADQDLPKLTGWWGTDPRYRFQMSTDFVPTHTADSWQLSNAPILSMAALQASLELFDEAGRMPALRAKTERQLAYLDFLLDETLGDRVGNITPRALDERGCQYSLRVTSPDHQGREVHRRLEEQGVACDWREPDVIRVAPVPLYNSFADILRFVTLLDEALS